MLSTAVSYIKIFRLPQIKPKIAAGMLYDRYPLSFDYSLCIPRSFQLVFMLRFLANRNVAFLISTKRTHTSQWLCGLIFICCGLFHYQESRLQTVRMTG